MHQGYALLCDWRRVSRSLYRVSADLFQFDNSVPKVPTTFSEGRVVQLLLLEWQLTHMATMMTGVERHLWHPQRVRCGTFLCRPRSRVSRNNGCAQVVLFRRCCYCRFFMFSSMRGRLDVNLWKCPLGSSRWRILCAEDPSHRCVQMRARSKKRFL